MSRATSFPPGTPAWIDLMTSDPEGARRFYAAVFGWDLDVGPEEFAFYTMAKVEGDVVAGLGGTPAPAEVPTSWTTYILTEDADDTAKKIIEGGGSIMLGPDTVGEEGRLLIAADPAGGVFGVWQPGNHKGAQRVNEPGALSWNELMTRDLATAKTFYSSLFGWTWDDLPGAPGFTYSTFKAGDRIAGGALEMNDQFPAEIPVHWMIYFAVADTDATVDAVVANGGSVLEPPRDSEFGRNAMVADPQGGIFRIIKIPEGMAQPTS